MVLFNIIFQKPLKFEVKKKLISRSERVKSVELHPEMPWVLVGLFSGNITIYDYSNQTTVKTLEVSQCPVRNAKFIARKQLIVAGSDDLQIRVYNYNTMEKVKQFEAHSDYIRYILVHPTQPYLLTSSDDSTVKLWDMDKDFVLLKTLEDHVHYVMMLALNPRDPNTFASASLDKTIKVWSLQGGRANFSLTGHTAGVNCIDYFKGDRPYLISGGDDRLIKIWDYQTKQCIHTLEGHQQNISAALFHPELPLIISTAEDGSIRFWHSQTYKLENTLNYNMERVWSIDISRDSSNYMAFGFDEGTVVVKIGNDEPVVSMNSGKVVYAKNMEFFAINLKAINTNEPQTLKDGSNLIISPKELGLSDIYPIGIAHSPNGHLFGIYSDQEYSIYRSQTFKNAGFGQGTNLIWSPTGDYAVREGFTIKVFKGSSNSLLYELKTDYPVQQLFGGVLLGAMSTDFVVFYHWETAKIVRRIDVSPKKIIWNDTSYRLAIATAEELYILQFHGELLEDILLKDEEPEGSEEAFDILHDLSENVTTGVWISDVFYYTNSQDKICYTTNGRVFVLDTEKKQFIIGYIQSQNRLYLMDKFFNISSYEINFQVAEFQSLITSNKIDDAVKLLKTDIDQKYFNQLAKFLDQYNMKELAFSIVTDEDLKFNLALQLGKSEAAFLLASKDGQVLKLRQVGDVALQQGKIELAIKALDAAQDLNGLFLIYSSLGLGQQLAQLGQQAQEQTKMNIAFQCFFTLGDAERCLQILIESRRFPEAGFFAKTYCPSRIPECLQLWKDSLQKDYPIISQKIANPFDFPEQYGDLNISLQVEKFYKNERQSNSVPAHQYQEVEQNIINIIFQYQDLLNFDLFQTLKDTPDYDISQFTLQPENTHWNNPYIGQVINGVQ